MEGKEKENVPSFGKQALTSMAVYTLSMSLGAAAGFTGVAIPQLKQKEEDGGFELTVAQISWLASLNIFSTIPMCLLGGMLGQLLGRKRVCWLVSPLFLAGFLCIAFAPNTNFLMIGRVLGGVGHGLVTGTAGVYITEICTPEWRTTFNSGLSAFYMIGMVIVYTLGKPDLLTWRWLAGVSCVFPVLSVLLLGFIPESPAWLVTQGRLDEARKGLVWLRGTNYDISEEFNKLEASYAKTQISKDKEERGRKFSLKNLQQIFWKLGRPDVFKPLLLVTTLSALQQFTGTATTTYYAVEILEVMGEGGGLDKYNATIIYGIIRLISTFMGGLLLRRFARRPLLVVSALFVALGMSLLGASNYISFNQQDLGGKDITTNNNNYSTTSTTTRGELEDLVGAQKSFFLNLLPLIGINMVAVSYQLGLGPIGWAYIGELYPVDMRTLLSGFSSMMVNVFIFIVIKTYPSLKVSALESWGTYWLYASIAVLGALFGATLLPETKGKCLAEVSDHFYVCCTLNKKRQVDDVEYDAINQDKTEDTTLSESFSYKHHNQARAILKDQRTAKEGEIERRFKRRSIEVGDKEGSLKRRTQELSMLDEEIRQKAEALREQEIKLKLKSAPIVQLSELDELLTED